MKIATESDVCSEQFAGTSMPQPFARPGGWDFTAALNLINAGQDDLATEPGLSPPPSLTHSESSDRESEPLPQPQVSLGNFDKLWQYLGTSAPTSSYADLLALEKEPGKRVKFVKEPKSVTWIDDKLDALTAALGTHEADILNGSPMTKQQRKKLRRRMRKLNGEQDDASDNELSDPTPRAKPLSKHTRPVSEGETDVEARIAIKRSKERQNIIQHIVSETPSKKSKKACIASPHDFFLHQVASKQPTPETPEPRYNLRSRNGASSIVTGASESTIDLTESYKKSNFIQLLFKRFQDDCATLAGLTYTFDSPYSSSTPGGTLAASDPSGIHVFVDISNILIGLHDAIKLKKGLTRNARLPRQKLSFYNFSLILERGRPTAKRCLAGSDMLECIDEAREIGYETNILERVMKEKTLTPRQRYFKARDRAEKSGASSGGEATSGPGSGTEEEMHTVTRRVEQAVDEILHLNMMLSIVDTAEPSTIVLATGDAAEAEYSEGFLSMCERALSKGWKVELVAFKHNMSFSYKRKDWIDRWSGRFTVIELDEFVEQLRL